MSTNSSCTKDDFEKYRQEQGPYATIRDYEEFVRSNEIFVGMQQSSALSVEQHVLEQLCEYGIPKKVCSLIKAGVEKTEAYEASFSGKTISVLQGDPGCGKTTAAGHWLYRQVLNYARKQAERPWNQDLTVWTPEVGIYFPTQPLMLRARDLSRISNYETGAIEKVTNASFLVVDDLGAEYLDKNGFLNSFLDEIVDVRYSEQLPVMFTTNLPPDQFAERYGERIVDRIRESGKFFVLNAPSMRAS